MRSSTQMIPNLPSLCSMISLVRAHLRPCSFPYLEVLSDRGRNSFLFLFSSHLGSTIVILRGPLNPRTFCSYIIAQNSCLISFLIILCSGRFPLSYETKRVPITLLLTL